MVAAEAWGEEWVKEWDDAEDKVADEAAAWARDGAEIVVWEASSTAQPSGPLIREIQGCQHLFVRNHEDESATC